MNKMNLSEYSALHTGIRIIARRHFQYNKPTDGLPDNLSGALTYTRSFDHGKLGLSPVGANNAFTQGEALVKLDIIPSIIITGIDQRNSDGARFTIAGIEKAGGPKIPYKESPAVTYPYYTDLTELVKAIEKFGLDYLVHHHLAGQSGVPGLWSEPVEIFEQRIMGTVEADYHWDYPILFDLNFEAILLLYYRLVQDVPRTEIPVDGWCPEYGDMIVVFEDGQTALFNANLELVEEKTHS